MWAWLGMTLFLNGRCPQPCFWLLVVLPSTSSQRGRTPAPRAIVTDIGNGSFRNFFHKFSRCPVPGGMAPTHVAPHTATWQVAISIQTAPGSLTYKHRLNMARCQLLVICMSAP